MNEASTELSTIDPKVLATYSEDLMEDTPVDVQDITIPTLLLQQSQSGIFKDGKSKIGEIRGSLEANLVAGPGEKVEFIPFGMYKTWVVLKAKGGGFIEQIPFASANLEREGVRDGIEVRNYRQLNYYCLLPKDIESGVYMPYVLSFRSTSYWAGKALETKRALLAKFKQPLCFKTFVVSTKNDTNTDDNDYQVYQVAESRNTTEKERAAVKDWHDIIKTKNVTVDIGEDEPEATEEKKAKKKNSGMKKGDEF